MTGETTVSTPVECIGITAVKEAVDGLTLAAITDRIEIVPVNGRNDTYFVFKIEIAA